ncbi:MAG: glycoside hydrolase family 3 protein [Selenomonadaceae bacterium]|nr:glycoside hydrolase family 3 protein [Selenomonadaceae bacterium]
MKKFLMLLMITTVFIFTGCFGDVDVTTSDMKGGTIKNNEGKTKDETEPPKELTMDSVEKMLKTMTTEEKIGQMIMIGVQGTAIDDDIRYSLNKFHFGGVVLFDRNMETEEQTKTLVNEMKKIGGEKIPMFIALDEEGGRIVRGASFLEPAPSQEEIAMINDLGAANYWAKYNAQLLHRIGANLNFAPVADVGTNDTRSFSYDTQTVTDYVNVTAEGYEEENCLYTLKHFPGLGKSIVDTHQEVSNVTADMDTLDNEDIPPFENIVLNHDNTKFMIMVGHLKYDAIDPDNSASLSSAVITDLLRNKIGYWGVVASDDLEMGAITNNMDISQAGVNFVLAGGDIALVCHEYSKQQEVYTGILEAVKNGTISEKRIDESVRKILRMKTHLQ